MLPPKVLTQALLKLCTLLLLHLLPRCHSCATGAAASSIILPSTRYVV